MNTRICEPTPYSSQTAIAHHTTRQLHTNSRAQLKPTSTSDLICNEFIDIADDADSLQPLSMSMPTERPTASGSSPQATAISSIENPGGQKAPATSPVKAALPSAHAADKHGSGSMPTTKQQNSPNGPSPRPPAQHPAAASQTPDTAQKPKTDAAPIPSAGAPAVIPAPPATTPPSHASSSSSELSVLTPDQVGCPSRASPATVQLPSEPREGDAAVGILYDHSMERHMGPEHYERPQRIIKVFETLQDDGLMGRCFKLPARKATDEELLRVHPQQHIDKVHSMYDDRPEEQAQDAFVKVFGDLYLCSETDNAARYAAGCVVEGVQQVLSGTVSSALAVVRPPGHHAECERAMGFCFFNNVAVAARAALQHERVKKVVVLDWDVHHGNGIQDALWRDPHVLYISIHRHPKAFYPFVAGFPEEVGEGEGLGFNINIPWQCKGVGDADYRAAFDLIIDPVISSFSPDLVIVAAGFDAARGDPLGGCCVTPAGYFEMTKRLLRTAAGGDLVLALEGGYNNRVTADCVSACVRALLGESSAESDGDEDGEVEDVIVASVEDAGLWPMGATGKVLKEVAKIQAPHWPVLVEGMPFEQRWDLYLDQLKAQSVAPLGAMRGLSIHSRGGSVAR